MNSRSFYISNVITKLRLVTLFVFTMNRAAVMAQSNGPHAPEAASFPVVMNENMVDVSNGRFMYQIPLMEVTGSNGVQFPVVLSYTSGIRMEQDASWVGLGWNINVGAISRNVVTIPDDVKNYSVTNVMYQPGGETENMTVGLNASLTKATNVGFYFQFGTNPGFFFNGQLGPVKFDSEGNLSASYAGINYNFNDNDWSIDKLSMVATGINSAANSFLANKSISDAIGITPDQFKKSMEKVGNASTIVNGTVGALGVSSSMGQAAMSVTGMEAAAFIPFDPAGKLSLTLHYKKMRYWYTEILLQYHYGIMYNKGAFDAHMAGEYASVYSQEKTLSNDNHKVDYSFIDDDDIVEGQDLDAERAKPVQFYRPSYDIYSMSTYGLGGLFSMYNPKELNMVAKYEHKMNNYAIIGQYDNNLNNDGGDIEDCFFSFLGENASYYNVQDRTYNTITSGMKAQEAVASSTTTDWNFDNSDYKYDWNESHNGDRVVTQKAIEFFTNKQLSVETTESVLRGFIECAEMNNKRGNSEYVEADGIGAFTVTSSEGINYHYSLPVYQFEEFNRTYTGHVIDDLESTHAEVNSFNRYAKEWLLTSITGPDYVDLNNNNMVDDGDCGYWISFSYGKWSDAYIWCSPYDEDKICKIDNQYCRNVKMGRKQLYYLDFIKTKDRIAYFIKDIRDDGLGKAIPSSYTKSYNQHRIAGSTSIELSDIHFDFDYNFTEQVKPLKLEKILLVENNTANIVSANSGTASELGVDASLTGSASQHYSYTIYNLNAQPIGTGGVDRSISDRRCYYPESVIDVTDDLSNLEGKILQEIDFKYDDENPLCQNAPNSIKSDINPKGGKLTLKGIDFKGRNNVVTMPSYDFEYYNNQSFNLSLEDIWGYYGYSWSGLYTGTPNPCTDYRIKSFINEWNLKSIKNPIGSKTQITYENNTYHNSVIQPFEEGAKSCLIYSMDNWHPSNQYLRAEVNLNSTNINELSYYFKENETTVSGSIVYDDPNISPTNYYNFVAVVTSVAPDGYINLTQIAGDDLPGGKHNLFEGSRLQGSTCSNFLSYGGGIRVKKVELFENDERVSYVEYDYNDPNTNKTSGVVIYRPALSDNKIPFFEMMPSNGVYYKNVTVCSKNKNGAYETKTTYTYDVPEPTPDFDETFCIDGFFNVETLQDEPEFANLPKEGSYKVRVKAKSIKVVNNWNRLGRLLNKKTLNASGDVLSSVAYEYDDLHKGGYRKEAYKTVTRVADQVKELDWYNIYNLAFLHEETWPNCLSSIVSSSPLGESKETNLQYDITTGFVLKKELESTSHKKKRIETVPAYHIYSGMGSKAISPDNANMLTQTAAKYIYSIDDNDNENLLSASIQTWKNDWPHRGVGYVGNGDYSWQDINESNSIWRKHENYNWNGEVNADGIYVNFEEFNWDDLSQNDINKWQKTSETERYSRYSAPLESRDINGLYSSTKMSSGDKVIASGLNTSYTEFCYTGMEDIFTDQLNWFGGEIKVHNGTTLNSRNDNSDIIHTGLWSANIVPYSVGLSFELSSATNLPKLYRVYVWSLTNVSAESVFSVRNDQTMQNIQKVKSGSFKFGNWYLLTADFLIESSNITVSLKNNTSNNIIVDDFRFQPVNASVNSYVYDEWGQLSVILNSNNIATRYEYSDAGQLKYVYKETPDGFKKVIEHNINYREMANN